ncbi:hypothetical protein [Niabella hirudinis]|uniref:hypothetical protein n=1 Tax=Niabella hirudinis TaxID=1285929 RepID=UPI003EB90A98
MKKTILAAIVALLMLNSQAQLKPIDPRITKAAEEKKRVNKILNAKLTKIRLIVSDYNVTPASYNKRKFIVKSAKSGGFSYDYYFDKTDPVYYNDGSKSLYWQFDRKEQLVTYKDLMNEGFVVTVELRFPQRDKTNPYEATFAADFIFSDGNHVIVSMKDPIMIKGYPQIHFKNPHIVYFSKTFAGPTPVIPDPEIPFVAPAAPK